MRSLSKNMCKVTTNEDNKACSKFKQIQQKSRHLNLHDVSLMNIYNIKSRTWCRNFAETHCLLRVSPQPGQTLRFHKIPKPGYSVKFWCSKQWSVSNFLKGKHLFKVKNKVTQLAPPPFLKSLCPLPSFLFYLLLRCFRQFPPTLTQIPPALIQLTNLSWFEQI